MPFKYINGKIKNVRHKTVVGRLVYDIGGLSKWPRIAKTWEEFSSVQANCTTPKEKGPKGQPVYDYAVTKMFCYPPMTTR